MAVELFGVGIAPGHHRRAFGDAQIGLAQPHPMLLGHAVEPLDRRMQQLGVGREGDVLGLLVWTAPRRHRMCQTEVVVDSDKGDRPWIILSELEWTHQSMFSSFMG